MLSQVHIDSVQQNRVQYNIIQYLQFDGSISFIFFLLFFPECFSFVFFLSLFLEFYSFFKFFLLFLSTFCLFSPSYSFYYSPPTGGDTQSDMV